MQNLSLLGSNEGARLAINCLPLRNLQISAVIDTLTKLHGIKTEARAMLNNEIITLKEISNV